MKNLNTTLQLILAVFLTGTLHAQQPGGQRGGNFDPSKLPKIGVLTGKLVDAETKQPLAFAAVKDHPQNERNACNWRDDKRARSI
jgi:hypothetical protein